MNENHKPTEMNSTSKIWETSSTRSKKKSWESKKCRCNDHMDHINYLAANYFLSKRVEVAETVTTNECIENAATVTTNECSEFKELKEQLN